MIAKLPPSKKKAPTAKKFVEEPIVSKTMPEDKIKYANPIEGHKKETRTAFPLWVVVVTVVWICIAIAALAYFWNS